MFCAINLISYFSKKHKAADKLAIMDVQTNYKSQMRSHTSYSNILHVIV